VSRIRIAALVSVVGALGIGCAGDQPDTAAPTTTAPPATSTTATTSSLAAPTARRINGLTATLEQYREDEIQGLLSVQTTNRSTFTVQFRDLRLAWAGLSDEEPYVRTTELGPGVTFDIRVLQGDAACGSPPAADGAPPPGAPVALGHVSVDGGPPELIAVPVEDRRAVLPRVYRTSCQAQHLAWAADLRFGAAWTPTTNAAGLPAMLGTIEVHRDQSDQTIVVTRVDGSVLLRINPVTPSAPVAVLAPEQQATTIPIVIEQSGNCAAHALAESKKTFFIPIGVAIGDEPAAAAVITFDPPAKALLNQLINESCGVG
jgi:hypothetical protein